MEREENKKEDVEGICNSYIRDKNGERVRCSNEGSDRYDNGLPAGHHCDSCWEKMVSDCRQRSW